MLQAEKQEVLVRGSAEHQDYLRYQFGRIKDAVNSFETRIAVSGRAMLLLYVVYITVKAATTSTLPHNMAPWLSAGLIILDIAMQALQVLGLEGSVPGLIHLAEELESQGKAKEARTIRFASNTAQWLLALTAIDIVLESHHSWGGYDIAGLADGYTNCLFIVRVIVIGLYLVAMAKLEHKGPRVISKQEAEKREEAEEQKQIRIDNATIMSAVQQAIVQWSQKQPDLNAAFSESIHRLESIVSRKIESTQQMQNEKIESMSRWVESLQFDSSSANSGASVESIEAMLSRSSDELSRRFESILEAIQRQVSQVEAAASTQMRALQAKVDRASSDAASSRIEATRTVATAKKVSVEPKAASQAASSNIIPIDRRCDAGLTKEDVLRLIEADESLASLSDAALGQKVGATKSTANRAKREWFATQGESPQQGDSAEIEAMNL